MKKGKYFFICLVLLYTVQTVKAQCTYNLINITHIDCYGDNNGSIDISLPNPDINILWSGPSGYSSVSTNLSNLFAGQYVLYLTEYLIPGDVNSTLICSSIDTLMVHQTLQISATFTLSGMCDVIDSADVETDIWGGTPPYFTIWNTGDTARNTQNLAPTGIPYVISITDANGCSRDRYLSVDPVIPMEIYMSSVAAICKDDEAGEAHVFVADGNPPFMFQWSIDTTTVLYDDAISSINGLIPGMYSVKVTDNHGCIIRDTIEVASNPSNCLKFYRVFSPNEDQYNPFWEIENIHMYPEALVEVYDRNGERVYRRRNYINANDIAFNGKDSQGNSLASGTYYFVIDLENEDEVFKGTVTIVR